ncbi:DUF4054 domain-containing protein [bacterium]|nr:DUF4054 domain-containing protein [bacterium]
MAAPASTLAALAGLCPPLYAAPEAIRTFWLDLAESQLGPEGWGDQRYTATAALAAHQWHRLTGGSTVGLSPTAAQAVGQVAAESAEKLSRTYETLKGKDPEEQDLLTTRYGVLFFKIRENCPAFGPGIVRVC